jgi:hypothetical protein
MSRRQVVQLLGRGCPKSIGPYERGVTLPPLRVALQLEIIYRTPIAFLFADYYAALRADNRRLEEETPVPEQLSLWPKERV